MQRAEHTFWFLRGPYEDTGHSDWSRKVGVERHRYVRFLRSLTTSNLQNVRHVHLVMQMFQAEEFKHGSMVERFFSEYFLKQGFRPTIFKITIRQSDWWDWESDAPLRLDERSVQAILNAPQLGGVEVFQLELETEVRKREELERIVDGLQLLEGKAVPTDPTDAECLLTSRFIPNRQPITWQWNRSSKLDGKEWAIFKNIKELRLQVVTLTWRKQKPQMQKKVTNSLEAGEGTLLYLMREKPYMVPAFSDIAAPAEVLRMRARRAMLNETRWNQVDQFYHDAGILSIMSRDQAMKFENAQRHRFEMQMGDMVANSLTHEWEGKRSLLKFGGALG